jgi:hypothetical protein
MEKIPDTADPVDYVFFKGNYYLFSTNQGYWLSNWYNWKFLIAQISPDLEHQVWDELCVSSLSFVNDTLLLW